MGSATGSYSARTSRSSRPSRRSLVSAASTPQCLNAGGLAMIRLGIVDFDTSHVVEFTKRLHRIGVPEDQWVDGAEDLIGRVDGVLIESQQGDAHLPRARPFLEAGLPLFIDKPFANSLHDAREIVRLAGRHGSPLFSSSSLRFTPELVGLLAD